MDILHNLKASCRDVSALKLWDQNHFLALINSNQDELGCQTVWKCHIGKQQDTEQEFCHLDVQISYTCCTVSFTRRQRGIHTLNLCKPGSLLCGKPIWCQNCQANSVSLSLLWLDTALGVSLVGQYKAFVWRLGTTLNWSTQGNLILSGF